MQIWGVSLSYFVFMLKVLGKARRGLNQSGAS